MDSMIGRAMRDAREKSRGLQLRAAGSVTPGMAIAGNQFSGMDALGRGAQSMAQHAEQLQHYTGYVYAIIRVIGNRVAGQPFRVASRDGAAATPGPRQRPSRPQDWVHGDSGSGGQGWRFHADAWKKHLPASVKGMSDGAKILDDHAILRCMANPNPIMVRSTVIFTTVASLQLTGKAHWWLNQTAEGYWQVWPIPSSWVEPVHGEGDNAAFQNWKMTVPGTGEPITVPGEQMVYFYYPDPTNPLGATSPLQALARTVLVDEALENSQLRAFQNGVNPGLALMVGRLPEVAGVGGSGAEPPVLTKEQRNQIINAVKAHYRGVVNTDEPLILDGLIKDAKKISATVREMDFLQSGVASRGRLCQGWGVSPISMGEIGSTRAESAVADDHLLNNVVNPLISMISEVMTARMAPLMAPGENLLLYLEEAKSRDVDFELQQANAMMSSGCMMVNERRAVVGLPPLKEGNAIILGGRLVPVEVDEPGVQRSPIVRVKSRPFKGSTSTLNQTQEAVVRSWLVQQAQAESAIKGAVHDYLVAVGEQICSEGEDRLRKDRNALSFKSPRAHEQMLEEYLDPERWAGGLRNALSVPMARAAYAGAAIEWLSARGFQKSGPQLPVEIERRSLAEVQRILSLDYWKSIFETAKKSATASLDYLKSEGADGHDLLTKAVRSSLGQGPALKKAEEISATEAAAAINAGAHLVRGQLGRVGKATHKVWWCVGDGNVRDAHREAHGQTVPIDEPFEVGGEQAQYPGDPSLSPKNRCRCRCATLTVGNSDYE